MGNQKRLRVTVVVSDLNSDSDLIFRHFMVRIDTRNGSSFKINRQASRKGEEQTGRRKIKKEASETSGTTGKLI